jgi:hypothetical protein
MLAQEGVNRLKLSGIDKFSFSPTFVGEQADLAISDFAASDLSDLGQCIRPFPNRSQLRISLSPAPPAPR